jgi:hypothetical protein
MDPALQVSLGQLKELKRGMSANQEEEKDITTSQDILNNWKRTQVPAKD